MQKSKTIFWDWNGTLLNDLHICIDAINILLRERNKPVIDQQIYRNIFTFPVRDYYVKAGFDFEAEPFEKPALEFIEQYEQLIKEAALFDDVTESLDYFRQMEYKQMILSAMQQDLLNELVSSHNIEHYFSKISGIDDHYATGKVDTARKLISDTVHDHEVGEELGIRVILVSRGHQSEERLKETGCEVARNFKEVIKLIHP